VVLHEARAVGSWASGLNGVSFGFPFLSPFLFLEFLTSLSLLSLLFLTLIHFLGPHRTINKRSLRQTPETHRLRRLRCLLRGIGSDRSVRDRESRCHQRSDRLGGI
jgi:hypothetical protein